MAAANPLPSLQALSAAAERDLGVMQDAENAAQASVLKGVQAQLAQLAALLSAVQARLDEEQRPYVTLAAYLGLSDPTVKFSCELPGSVWLQREGEVLYRVPVYGGAFEVQLLCSEVGAAEAGVKRWEPYFKTKVVVTRVQEERAAQLLALLPVAQVQLMQFAMTPTYRDEYTGTVLQREVVAWACGGDKDIARLPGGLGGVGVGKVCKLNFGKALEMMGVPPFSRPSRAEAVDALEVALKALTFMVTGELRLSA